MKNSYAAIGRTVPEVGYHLGDFLRLPVEGGEKAEEKLYSSEIVSVKQLIEFVWLVTTETSVYLFLNRSIAEKKNKGGKVVIGVTGTVPKSRSNTEICIMTGDENNSVRKVTVTSPVCNRLKGHRDVYYVETADKLYIVLVNNAR